MKFGDGNGHRRGAARQTTIAFLVLACLAFSAGMSQAGEQSIVVQVFRVEHASVAEVSNAIQPLLSDEGSMTLQPAKGRITVRDRADVMRAVSEAVQRIDQEPVSFRIHVELLEGSKAPMSVAAGPDVEKRLKQMFPFKFYRTMGTADLGGVIGDEISVELNDGFFISMTVLDHRMEPTPFGIPNQHIRFDLRPLVLERVGSKGTKEILRTRVVLSENQDVVIGAGVKENSAQGLVLIIKALPEE